METQFLTVADLVATASLNTRVLAGADGVGRQVLWAHSCEMTDPEHWLGPHELLMTVGLCIPSEPEQQAAFVARLDDAGLAGMMIGDHAPAPDLSAAMFAEADRRGFPLLLAGPQIPYAVVARHVAAVYSSRQTLQVLKLSKIYHLAAYADDDNATLTNDLSSLLGVGVQVVDDTTGSTLLRSEKNPADTSDATSSHAYALHGGHDVTLTITEFAGEELDSFLLIHLMKVLEVAVDRQLNDADRRSEVSARLMLSLLNGTALPETTEFMQPHLPSDGFQLVAFPADDGRKIARAIAAAKLPIIVGAGRISHLALVPAVMTDSLRTLVEGVTDHAGVSSVFTDYVDTRVAAVEAGKVLAAAQHSDRFWTEFEGTTVSVLTRSNREAADIIAGVLGPLAEDSPRAVNLRQTLFAYLRNDRRWNDTAAELSIHRQTLSYRLGKIEDETGLTLTKSSDLSALWIAYQAWESIAPAGTNG
jgi:PucR family transcriptional regulator, purine catabolism regulatory protein